MVLVAVFFDTTLLPSLSDELDGLSNPGRS